MNKQKVIILLLISVIRFVAYSQEETDSLILFDDFSTNAKFIDLSEKLIWSNSEEVVSGFKLNNAEDLYGVSKTCLSLTNEAMKKTGYKPGSIKASQAIDYVLPEKLNRNNSTYKIEFDALWDELNNGGWGESGRIVITLLHDYPEEIPFDAIYDLSAEAPFGRPAYNLRIRNHDKTGPYFSGSFMLYGGGHDEEGEIEIYNNEYWLPGFSSEAGGTTPGLSAAYPFSPTMKNENLVTVGYPEWKHYTWLINPERLEFYIRNSSEDESENQLVFFMQIPKTTKTENQILEEINEAHKTSTTELPVLYNWFQWIEAVRIYFRGSEQAHLANFKISKELNQSSTGIQASHKFKSRIYPNPCSTYFYIEKTGDKEIKYALLNQSGQTVKRGQIAERQKISKIQTVDQPAGIYFLQTVSNDESDVQKIIINK